MTPVAALVTIAMRNHGYVATSRRHVAVVLVVLLLQCVHISGVSSDTLCEPCDGRECPAVSACTGAHLVLDTCGCCETCVRLAGESCSVGDGAVRCNTGLRCDLKRHDHTTRDTAEQMGTCVEIDEKCAKTKCPIVFDPVCPEDSFLSGGVQDPEKCCPVARSCVCQPCPQVDPLSCALDEIKVIRSKGNSEPGSCCDKWSCENREVACKNVTCGNSSRAEEDTESQGSGSDLHCPLDSHPLTPEPTHGGCCTKSRGCGCLPPEFCPETPLCDAGYHLQVALRATGEPGACCDVTRCVNESELVCRWRQQVFRSGATWSIDTCSTCTCHKGLTFCAALQCDKTVDPECEWTGIPTHSCCPVCLGCITRSGELHSMNSSWTEQNGCVHCTCVDGVSRCLAEQCTPTCSEPRQVVGQCCPVCDEETTAVATTVNPKTAGECPNMETCILSCTHGLRKRSDGCYVCQCALESCSLGCDHGYTVDASGLWSCHCASPTPAGCADMRRCQKQCGYGFQFDEVRGCPRCKCRQCAPLVCHKRCLNGYESNKKGCKLCRCKSVVKDNKNNSISSSKAHKCAGGSCRCVTSSGGVIEEGEAWFEGCWRCYCRRGAEMCSPIVCARVNCRNPVIRPGECCASCGGFPISGGDFSVTSHGDEDTCRSVDGQVFAADRMWRVDACTQCVCHGGRALCQIESCPPLVCSHPVLPPDRCCPVCAVSDWQHAGPAKYGKSLSCVSMETGMKYADEHVWRVGDCQSCGCVRGQIHCFAQSCPVTKCNTTVRRKGQCCATCFEDPKEKQCRHNEAVYSSRESWLDGACSQCVCIDGVVKCLDLVCKRPACLQTITIPGVCCPVCSNYTDLIGFNQFTKADALKDRVTVISLVAVIVALLIAFFLLAIFYVRTRIHRSGRYSFKGQGHTAGKLRTCSAECQACVDRTTNARPEIAPLTRHDRCRCDTATRYSAAPTAAGADHGGLIYAAMDAKLPPVYIDNCTYALMKPTTGTEPLLTANNDNVKPDLSECDSAVTDQDGVDELTLVKKV